MVWKRTLFHFLKAVMTLNSPMNAIFSSFYWNRMSRKNRPPSLEKPTFTPELCQNSLRIAEKHYSELKEEAGRLAELPNNIAHETLLMF